jgi:hypothetical protein
MSAAKKPRDPRLDVFRGLTMFIIFIAHVPGNAWNDWIPARFGFSSGSELFVFCSGAASAIAFGGIFVKRGWWLGTVRILYRVWQVYWAHAALVLALLAMAAAADRLAPGHRFFDTQFAGLGSDPAGGLLAIVTLRWLPDYLDILPMYLVILAMVPLVMALRRVAPPLALALPVAMSLAVWITGMNFVGNPFTGTPWFFNPFGWQLVFFAGFAFMSGWLPVPPLGDRRLMIASAVFLLACVPVAFWGIRNAVPVLDAFHDLILPGREKTDAHPLRLLHFLVLAYLVLSLVEPHRERLSRGLGAVLVMVGQQSLATFLASVAMARIAWILLDVVGRTPATVALANLGGFAGIILVAKVVGYVKSAPWASSGEKRPAPPPAAVGQPAAAHGERVAAE